MQITTTVLHCEKIVKFDNWYTDSWHCGKSIKIGTNDLYRVQAYQVSIVNPRWPSNIQDGRHKIQFFFLHFHIRRRWFHAHHRDRLVICYVWYDFHRLYPLIFKNNNTCNLKKLINWMFVILTIPRLCKEQMGLDMFGYQTRHHKGCGAAPLLHIIR